MRRKKGESLERVEEKMRGRESKRKKSERHSYRKKKKGRAKREGI